MKKYLFLLLLSFIGLWSCGKIFDEPLHEHNPNLKDTTLNNDTLNNQSGKSSGVRRKSILESFGSFNCVSCPEAEKELAPYIHADGSSLFNKHLLVVNYHAEFFSGDNDEWITTLGQKIYDQYGFTSLPQVMLNGLNAPYGFPEQYVPFKNYDALMDTLFKQNDTLTFLEIKLDSSSLVYDTLNHSIEFLFSASNNNDSLAMQTLQFRVIIVKNQPLVFSLQTEFPWEVVVVGGTDTDKTGNELIANKLPSGANLSFAVKISDLDETDKHKGRGGLGFPLSKLEKINEYAIIIMAIQGSSGIIQNALDYQYNPQKYKP